MTIVGILVQFVLSGVFAIAGAAKLFNRNGTHKMMRDFGVPAILANPLGMLLPLGEIAVAVALLGPWAWWGAVGALALLLIFILGITTNLLFGRKPDCNCFGQLRSRPVGWTTVVRNVVLALCAGLLVAWDPTHDRTGTITAGSGLFDVHLFETAIGAFMLAVIAAEGIGLWHLFLQNGRLLLRMDQLEQRSVAYDSAVKQGLPVGSPAPAFELATPSSGVPISLASLQASGSPVVLIFSDTDCQPCGKLLPEIHEWQQQYENRIRIAVVSRGSDKAHLGLAERYKIADLLKQAGNEVAEAFKVVGTPAGVAIDANGNVCYDIALGRDEIKKLLVQLGGASLGAFPGETRPLNNEPEVRPYGTAAG